MSQVLFRRSVLRLTYARVHARCIQTLQIIINNDDDTPTNEIKMKIRIKTK